MMQQLLLLLLGKITRDDDTAAETKGTVSGTVLDTEDNAGAGTGAGMFGNNGVVMADVDAASTASTGPAAARTGAAMKLALLCCCVVSADDSDDDDAGNLSLLFISAVV